MELNWDAPVISGQQSFFTETSFNQFSIAPKFPEVLSSHLSQQRPPKEKIPSQAAEPLQEHLPHSELQTTQNAQQTTVKQPVAATKSSPPAISYPIPRIPFPCLSVLTHVEQKTYMELFRKYQFYNPARPPGPQEMREIQQFRDLQMKVGPEQEEFMRYLEFVATQSPQDYSFLQPQARQYMQEVLAASSSLPVLGYPQFYTVYQTVGISTLGFKTDPVMRHVKTLLEMGSVPGLKLPKANEAAKILPSYEDVVEHKPAEKATDKNTTQKVVSEDENAEKLAAKYGAHIVISASALCTLLDNHAPHYQEQWELPVTVKESVSTGDTSSTNSSKTVIIDKPLPRKKMTMREKNTLFHTVALELFLMDRGAGVVLEKLRPERYTDIHNIDVPREEMEHPSSFEGDVKQDETIGKMEDRKYQEREEEDFGNSQDLADLETFGEGSRSRKLKKASAKPQLVQVKRKSIEKEDSPGESQVKTRNKEPKKVMMKKEAVPSQREVTKDEEEEEKPHVENEDTVEESWDGIAENRGNASALQGFDSNINSQKKGIQVDEEGRHEVEKKDKTEKIKRRGNSSQDSDSDFGMMIVTDSDSQGERSPLKISGRQRKVSGTLPCSPIEQVETSGDKKETKQLLSGIEGKLHVKEMEQQSLENEHQQQTDGGTSNNAIESAMTGMTLRSRRSAGQAKSSMMSPPPVKRQRTMDAGTGKGKVKKGSPSKTEEKSKSGKEDRRTENFENVEGSFVQEKIPQLANEKQPEDKMDTSDVQDVPGEPAVPTAAAGGSASKNKCEAVRSEPGEKGGVLDTVGQIMQLQENLQKFQAEGKQGQALPSIPQSMTSPPQPSSCPQATQPGVKLAPHSSAVSLGVKLAPHSREQLEYCLPPDLKLCQESLQDYSRPDRHNVVYSLMSFGKLLLLVRSDLQAVCRSAGGHFKWFVHVRPKLEYQPDFGVEQLTPGEMCREWISTYIMPPDSRLVRVRINAFTSEVMLVEQLKHNQILDHRVPFSPGTAMKMLLSVLEKVQSLPVGQFLLTHNPGDVHICIHQGVDAPASRKGAYDLHSSHKLAATEPVKETRPPWVPLDPSIILPQHWQNWRVPATFEPRPPNPPPTTQRHLQPGKKKNKGKKKKTKQT